jgi:hypothetical protein
MQREVPISVEESAPVTSEDHTYFRRIRVCKSMAQKPVFMQGLLQSWGGVGYARAVTLERDRIWTCGPRER